MWFFLEGDILAMNHKFLKSFLGGKNSNADVHTLKQSPNTCKKSPRNTIDQKDFCTSLNYTLKQSPNTCKKSHQETINQNDFSTSLNYDPDKIKTREKSSEQLVQA